MVEFDFNQNCYGCKNCENICPRGAIKFIENEEGFLMPMIDRKACIDCGLCDKVCPHLNIIKKDVKLIDRAKWYSCFLSDEKEIEKSTSGAIFPKIAEKILKDNGMICGCIWNEEMFAEHVLTEDKQIIEKMRGSKYLQSDLKKCVKDIKKVINDRKVLFTGTPCQVAAIKLFIGENDNLYTCSLICEGVPSNKVWRKYKEKLEDRKNSKLEKVIFRNKEIGWESPIAKYIFKNGKEVNNMAFNYDRFVLGFLQGLYYRNSCTNCKYKCDGHNADIIIGDFWGVTKEILKESKNRGVSAVITNTKKGNEIFESVCEDYIYQELDYNKIIEKNPRIMTPMKKNNNRETFFKNIDKIDIIKNISNNLEGNNKIRLMKQIAYKTKTFSLLKKIIK